MRLTISRTSRPVKTSDNPHETSDDSIANAATNATAPRAVFGIDASRRVSRATGGDDATTNPPMITIAICMVKLTSDQNPFPNSVAIVTGVTPANMPPMKTSTIAASAKTNASGNHRSQTSAMRDPARARRGGGGIRDCKHARRAGSGRPPFHDALPENAQAQLHLTRFADAALHGAVEVEDQVRDLGAVK